MKYNRILSLVLTVLLVSLSLISCAGDPVVETPDTTQNSPDTTESTPVDETTVPAETEYPAPEIDAVDYGGVDFRILVNEPRADMFPYSEIDYSEEMGDVVNDAIFKRNAQVTEKYKINIVTTDVSTGQGKAKFLSSINAGNDDFHIAAIRINDIISLASAGYLADANSLPYIDTDAPWYYQRLQNSVAIGEADYALMGYLNMRIFDTAGALFYNKNMVKTYELPDIEQLVFDGKFTLDQFYELCAKVGNDLNQDGKLDETDVLGLTSHPGNLLNYFVGAGGEFVSSDKDGIPTYVGINERNEAILTKVMNIMLTEPAVLHQDSKLYKDYTGAFMADRSLFLSNGIYRIRDLAQQGANFGVLPLPKYDENQENYLIHIGAKLGTAIGIPHNSGSIEMVSAVVEDMMYLSYKYIYPAHIEKTMQLRFATDENSTKIVKLLFNSLSLELSTALDLNCDTILRTLGSTRSTNVVSAYEASAEKNQKQIENFVNSFNK